jgi:hypothetical protein
VSDVAAAGLVSGQAEAQPRVARLCWSLAAVAALALAIFHARNEWPTANAVYAASVTGAVAALAAAATRRVLFGVFMAGFQVVVVALAARVKLQTMDMLVHAYDLFFYFRSWSTVAFLAQSYPWHVLGLVGAILAGAALGAVVYRLDATRIDRGAALAAALALTAAASAALASLGERRHMHLYYADRYLSTYYSSWPETLRTLWRGQLIDAAPQASGPALRPLESCGTPHRKPHIILIHQESIVPPSLFPGLAYDRAIDPFFRSHDGGTYRMRVETYGGASWLTEFSVLAGVSTHSFGSMRQFVQAFMEGKVRETIPQVLAACGYRNVLFYPMLKNFVSNARFYESIGLTEIFDMRDQKAKTTTERDRFYYANALDEIGRHVEAGDRPLFTFIQTMSAHWPYDVRMFANEDVPGGAPDAHPEVSEYLRRLSLAARDYAWLLGELKRRFPHESFVIVNYGDHQPSATRLLLGQRQDVEVEDIKLAAEGPGFLTYYSIATQNWRAPAPYPLQVMDVPYLGLALLEAARLPLSDAYRERKRLMLQCNGRYHSCADEQAVLAFHRRLIDAGLMESR